MILVAYTMSNKMEEIKLSDCPIVIAPNMMSLFDVCDSPIYFADSVIMFDEVHDVAEGDVVEDKESGLTGTVFYGKGWRIHWSSNDYSKFNAPEHISMINKKKRNLYSAQSVRNIPEREEIMIVVDGVGYYLTSMMAKHDSCICISGRPQLVSVLDIHLSTGILDKYGDPFYFGQFYKGGIIGLSDEMRIVSKSQRKIINMEENN